MPPPPSAQHLALGSTEGGGGILDLCIELGQDRLDAAHAEGERHEQQCGADAEAGAGQVDVEGAAGAVEREQGQPGHDGRQREGEIDDGAHDRLAPEVVTNEHPCDGEPGDGVDEGDDQRGTEGELERRHRLGLGDGRPEAAPAPAEGVREQRGDREEDQQREVGDGERRTGHAAGSGARLGQGGGGRH